MLSGVSSGGNLNRLADVAPPGKVPCIREVLALLGLHLLDRTLVPLEEVTGSIFTIDQCQPAPIGTESGVLLDEDVFLHAQMV